MKILILGGTKFLGPHLVEAARDHEVTLFHRQARPPHVVGNRDPEIVPGLENLRGRSWDTVIDTSGRLPRHVRASAELLRDTYYLFVSTISAYADHSKPGQTEDGELAQLDDPADETMEGRCGGLKAACEATVVGPACIVRPGLIVGPGDPTDRFTYWPVRMAQGGSVLSPGDGSDPIQVIDVRDLCDWMIRLVETQTTGIFNAVGPSALPRWESSCRPAGPRALPGSTFRCGSPPPHLRPAATTRSTTGAHWRRDCAIVRFPRRPPIPWPGGRACPLNAAPNPGQASPRNGSVTC